MADAITIGLREGFEIFLGLMSVGGPVGAWFAMRERLVKVETRIDATPDKAAVNDLITASVTASRKELIEEMRREDGRVANTDGERDGHMRHALESLASTIADGFKEIRADLRNLNHRVAQDHGLLDALVRHTKRSDPHFVIPTVVTRSRPEDPMEALDEPSERFGRR